MNVIAGEPGSGKTLFALQMLFHQARQGKKSLYLTTLSEPSLKLVAYMQQFSFFEERFVDREIVFADLGSVLRNKGAEATLAEITGRVEREEPAIIVIDSFKALRDILGDTAAVRAFVYDLTVHTASWGAVSLFLGEYTQAEILDRSEFAIADGIIRFGTRHEELTAIREVEVLEAPRRGLRHRPALPRDRLRTGSGSSPGCRGPRPSPAAAASRSSERAATGIDGLDRCSAADCRARARRSSRVGRARARRSSGCSFSSTARVAGSPASSSRWRRRPTSCAPSPRLRLGTAAVRGARAADTELRVPHRAVDRLVSRSRRGSRFSKCGARRVVLDSLTSLAIGVLSERRFKELVYAFTKHFRALGVTLHMNMEMAELLGSAQLSGYGISFAADNVIQLQYIELEGRLERGISVLKVRGVKHSTEVRKMTLGAKGVEVGFAFKGLRGVLTGLPARIGMGRVMRESLGRALQDIAQILDSSDGLGGGCSGCSNCCARSCPSSSARCSPCSPDVSGSCSSCHVHRQRCARRSPRCSTTCIASLVEERVSTAGDAAASWGGHIAVPLVGDDRAIGVLLVRGARDGGAVHGQHLRELAIVGSLLAGYLVTVNQARTLDRARREAELANRTKDEFMALISLELKAPLTSTLLWARMLRTEDAGPCGRVVAATAIERSVEVQTKLVDEILELACIATARLRLD